MWSLLARPVTSSEIVIGGSSGSKGAFDHFANELMDMIFKYVSEDESDTMALAFTCHAFWEMAFRHVRASYLESAAPWAGIRIVFLQNWTRIFPACLNDCKLGQSIMRDSINVRLHVHDLFQKLDDLEYASDVKTQSQSWVSAARQHRQEAGIPQPLIDKMIQALSSKSLFPNDQTWLLRNLTTRELVSRIAPSGLSEDFAERIMTGGSKNRGKEMKEDTTKEETAKATAKATRTLRFEDVILMQTCWADKMFEVHSSHLVEPRGPWAGHRFDIVTEDVHHAESSTGWRDVSAKMCRQLNKLKRMKAEIYATGSHGLLYKGSIVHW